MLRVIAIVCIASICLSSCYSFKGGSINPEVKSVNIQNFGNISQNGNTVISQDITDRLRDKFLDETRLVFADDADWNFEGQVTGYALSSRAPSGSETSALARLTITVRIKYTDNLNTENNWQQNFSAFADYSSTTLLSDVEDGLVVIINNQIVVDIFNRATANW